jgi:hypothetical protein
LGIKVGRMLSPLRPGGQHFPANWESLSWKAHSRYMAKRAEAQRGLGAMHQCLIRN